MKNVIELTKATFEQQVVKADRPVVVDFWAEWCGPCKMLGPVLEEVALEQQGRAVVAKLNIDDNPEVAAQFGIRSIPTLLYFRDGQLRDQTVGVVSKKTILSKLEALGQEASNPSRTA